MSTSICARSLGNTRIISMSFGLSSTSLLPEVFNSVETFDECFQISGFDPYQKGKKINLVLIPIPILILGKMILLKPLIGRRWSNSFTRLKSHVEKNLPPKKETRLKVGMSRMQKQYYHRALHEADLKAVGRSKLLNRIM